MHLPVSLMLWLALVGVAVTLVGHALYLRFFHPLSHFPGPFLASVTRLWLAIHAVRGDEAETLLRLHKRYGPIVRISPTLLAFSDARLLPVVYHRYADKTKQDAPMLRTAPDSLFSLSDHKAHARARRMIGRPYSTGNVLKLEPFVDTHVSHLLAELDVRYAQPGESFDFAPWASYLAYDIISDIAFGAPLGCIATGSDVGSLIHGLHEGWALFGFLARCYTLKTSPLWLVQKLLATVVVPSKNVPSGFGLLLRTRERLLKQRRAELAAAPKDSVVPRQDMLQAILDARDDTGAPLPLSTVRAETLNILIAGAETTGTTIQTLVRTLLCHPAALARCRAEIKRADAKGWLSTPAPSPAEVHAHLPFYIACLRETWRLYPPLPGLFPRLVTPPGVMLDHTRFVTGGFEVTANAWIVGRDTALYGVDAEMWRPERWEQADENQVQEWLRLSFVFGYGARVCLGKDIAMMEVLKAGVGLLRRFDIERVSDEEQWVVRGGVGWWENLNIKLTPIDVTPSVDNKSLDKLQEWGLRLSIVE